LTIDPAAGYTGVFYVDANVSDGTTLVTKSFKVSVTNSAPTVKAIGAQILSNSTGTIAVPLSVADVDNDSVTLSARAYTVDPITKLPTTTVVPSNQVALSLSGNQLRITRAADFTGDFYVNVTANDGANSVVQSFKVTAVNSTVRWLTLKSLSTSTQSVVFNLSQQLAMAKNASASSLPAMDTGSNSTWAGASNLTQSYDILGSASQANAVSLFNNDTTRKAVELAFHESHVQSDSWLSNRIDNLNNIFSDTSSSGNGILNSGVGNRVRDNVHDVRNTDSDAAESILLNSIEESLHSWQNPSSDHESIDEYFAAL
jgi:hypothetical protein